MVLAFALPYGEAPDVEAVVIETRRVTVAAVLDF
jgi:hypothetical protein